MLLERCLDSIAVQSFSDYEVIVADDSTRKETAELVRTYTPRLPILYEHHEKGLGSPGNWNRALELAKGKWVLVLHQDDWLSGPGSLQRFMDAVSSVPDIFFAFGNIEPEEKASEIRRIPARISQLRQRPERIIRQNIIGPPSNVVFRNEGHRFDPELFWVVDIEMYYRWLTEGKEYIHIPEKLVEIGRHDAQVTAFCDRNPDIKLRENAMLLSKHDRTVRMDLPQYDYVWRQIRNTSYAVPGKMAGLAPGFPPVMKRQWVAQQALNRSLLRKGWYSKIMMIFSWLKERTRN
jgi:glycosyltransferase involved in cell wall biosynthesis